MKQLSLLFVILLLASCNIINPDEREPTYITINDIELQASADEGGNSNNIKDAWVYVNSEFIGAYQMPTTFPVLGEGEKVIEVFAGIKVNGISEFPDQYPLYERDSIFINLDDGENQTISPVVTYREDADFIMIEQFSSGDTHNMSFDADGISETEIEVVGGSGIIHLDTENRFFDIASLELDEFPQFSNVYYMEMDYKSDVLMNVGLVGYDNLNTPIVSNFNQGILPTTEWTKIYFDLSGPISDVENQLGVRYYRLHLTAAINPDDSENPMTEADIYLDNLKLVKFE
ncbi:MAG: hypothetical protein AB8F74_08660 [Saprospiraceae bacterium]